VPTARREQALDELGGARPAHEEALRHSAGDFPQGDHLVVDVDPLGDDRQRQRLPDAHDRLQQIAALPAVVERRHEAPVDLEHVHGHALQVRERRVARAEVVDHDAHAERPDLLQPLAGRADIAHQRRLGDLERQHRRRDARLVRRPVDVLGEALAPELERGDVHRHADLVACGLLARRLTTGLAEHPAPDRDDLARLLGQWYELVGGHDAALGVVPADQRLRADDRLAVEVEDRLVEQEELFAHTAELRSASSSRRSSAAGFMFASKSA
jgi:hypothetical protein